MKKIIKFIKNNILGFLVGLSLCLNGVIIAENMITSEQVSYSGSKTEETTVKGTLDELFSAIDINERLGSTDISSIGNGTITDAISNLKTQINNTNNLITELNSDNNLLKKYSLLSSTSQNIKAGSSLSFWYQDVKVGLADGYMRGSFLIFATSGTMLSIYFVQAYMDSGVIVNQLYSSGNTAPVVSSYNNNIIIKNMDSSDRYIRTFAMYV